MNSMIHIIQEHLAQRGEEIRHSRAIGNVPDAIFGGSELFEAYPSQRCGCPILAEKPALGSWLLSKGGIVIPLAPRDKINRHSLTHLRPQLRPAPCELGRIFQSAP
jgi:hypothetical protein